ncbi:helix-turn-helix transcriptional regulator [Pseudokineococcus marinus]|uniref:Helix-turn-helix transcriptional regulator n=1 Tax=Pseudokineococcus marinus TaxID=351215 RepID=A0A849BRE0_9ACTN|nr:helix-turn-helix transcriptional regulator [Pseudokineococcus marinus]NNH22086.1 helix-turn-helix transcriptional regulator [Pseudokineococcus marinus]
MAIVVDLDVVMARRKVRLGELAERTGITVNNLSVLKNGRARAVRFTTLEAVCAALDCQPGDLLRWEPDDGEDADRGAGPLAGRRVDA